MYTCDEGVRPRTRVLWGPLLGLWTGLKVDASQPGLIIDLRHACTLTN